MRVLNKVKISALRTMNRARTILADDKGDFYISDGVKIIIAVVLGALLLAAIFANLDAAQNYVESLRLHELQYPKSIVTFLVCNRQKTSLQPWYQREMEAIRLMEKTGQTYLDKSFCIFVKTHIENLKKLPTKEAA